MQRRLLPLAAGIIFLALINAAAAATPAAPGEAPKPGESLVAPPPIDQVLKRHASHLLALPGVVAVAQGLCGESPCIRVFVRHKTAELAGKIPATLEGYPVVLQETGVIRPLPGKEPDSRSR